MVLSLLSTTDDLINNNEDNSHINSTDSLTSYRIASVINTHHSGIFTTNNNLPSQSISCTTTTTSSSNNTGSISHSSSSISISRFSSRSSYYLLQTPLQRKSNAFTSSYGKTSTASITASSSPSSFLITDNIHPIIHHHL